ncbi:MAG: FAD:protein FMN transferase [Acidaminococcaceae bacterium]
MKNLCVFLLILSSLLNAGCFSQPKPYKDTRFIMDTTISIEATGKNTEQVKIAVTNAFQAFQEIADETDRYKDNSSKGLYQLNAHAGLGPFPVGPHLLRLVDMAHQQTFREFDITLGPLIDVWRKHSSDKTVPGKQEIDAALSLTGQDKFSVASDKQSITLQAGAALDLGAIAKGYAVDVAAEILAKDENVSFALVNAGGNIKTVGTKADGKPWRIALQDPRRSDAYLGVINLKAGEAVATSGDYQRYYEIDGIRYHHILDPHTGMPSRNAISVTIVAASAFMTDYYSTLLFVLPHEKVLEVLAVHPEIAAIVVKSDGETYVSPSLQSRLELAPAGGK